jgi:cardiolipin synthase
VSATKTSGLEWLRMGREIFPAILAAIAAAKESIVLESYIYSDDKLGREFLLALVAAAKRGVKVEVLVDAMGSWLLPDDFFQPLIAAGGGARRFNPLRLWRFGVRDHRKLLVCDSCTVFIGGFNISEEYNGDGLTHGWCDLGVRIENTGLAKLLEQSFHRLFQLADFRRKPLLRLRLFKQKRKTRQSGDLFVSNPGRGASQFQLALYRDLAAAKDVRIVSAYFLPTRRLRRELVRVVKRGGRVQLILGAKTDVPVSQLAARSMYHRLLKRGVEIYEYQPQILHAKLVLCGGATYIGSSNLDIRSLNLNYELMLRSQDREAGAEAREIFDSYLEHCKKIELEPWLGTQSWWRRWKYHWAHFLLARIDPLVSLRQFRRI